MNERANQFEYSFRASSHLEKIERLISDFIYETVRNNATFSFNDPWGFVLEGIFQLMSRYLFVPLLA
jgi:hypothetical protein